MPEISRTKRLGFFTRLLDDVGAKERYELALLQIQHAENEGYDTAWVAQHHFHAEEGGLPAPLVFLAHAAAKTRHIRLGTGVITLPMENPVRIAEDTAVLDLISNGRLEIGLGSGGTRESFETFGIDPDKRREVFAEGLGKLRSAWRGENLGGGNSIYPAAPHLFDRIWLATFSVGGAELAGKAGGGLMLSRTQPRPNDNPNATLAELQDPLIDAYLANLPAGRQPQILGSRSLFVADDRKDAIRLAEAGLRRAAQKFAEQGHRFKSERLEDLIEGFDAHVGTPDEVVESLRRDTTLERVTDVSFQVHSIDPPHEFVLRSIELAAREVAPRLGWTETAAPKLVLTH